VLDALLFTKTPSLLTAVYPECLWKVNTKEKIIYLTFDDGPIPEITPFILDELKKWNAKATFFCIGKNVEANPEIFERIINEGHSVGNHTYDHLNGWNVSDEVYFENIEKCAAVLSAYYLLPIAASLFRPPYGKLKPSQYTKLKSEYKLVMWDVLSFDFDLKMEEEKILKNVLDNAEAGSIVVMHDSLKAKPKVEFALPKLLEHFTQKGFKFEKL
jgi:peptidoglycan/xylan/chitin deacetylase (PgdA/CDA1 family)